MKYQLEIFVEGQRLDVFDYEALNLKKSTKDFKDISKVFTSFSRSITIPASKSNNKVFKHYNNSAIVQGGFDGRSLKDAELKVNGVSLEKGKMGLESVKKRNGEVYSYSIRFYGGLTELKKRLGEDYLHNLDLSDDNVINPSYYTLLQTNLSLYPNLAFILSSLNRRFIYAKNNADYVSDNNLSGQGIVNIGVDAGASTLSDEYGVIDNDLVGVYRVGALIEAIESKYNLTMTGAVDFRYISEYRILLNSSNRELTASTLNTYIDYSLTPFVFSHPSFTYEGVNFPSRPTVATASLNGFISTTNEFEKQRINFIDSDNRRQSYIQRYALRVCVQTTMTNFEVEVLRNGELVGTISESKAQETGTFSFYGGTDTVFRAKDYEGDADWSFRVKAAGNGSVTVSYRFAQRAGSFYSNATSYNSFTINATTSGDDFYNVSANLPKMKVKDFIGVLMKQFNLIPEVTVNESGTHNIDFKHYDYYIYQGESYDIADYVDIDSETVKPANIYSGIEFKYNEPKTAMQQAFATVNKRNYGELNYQISENEDRISGSSFEMDVKTNKLPIERLSNLSDTSDSSFTAWLQLTDLSNNKVDLGNCFLYAAQSNHFISYNNGVANASASNVVVPSNLFYSSQSVTSSQSAALCGNFFGAESDEIYLNSKNSSLGFVNLFWDNYLSMMFDNRTRKVKLSAYLPERIMISLNTNDKLNINDRLFIIESFNTNFQSGKTDLELIEVSKDVFNLFNLNDEDFTSDLSPLSISDFHHIGLNSTGEMISQIGYITQFIGNVKNRYFD